MSDTVRYFSNGTEGALWMAEHCDRCVHDHEMHGPDGDGGCVHVLATLTQTFDPVFIRTTVKLDSGYDFHTWDCVEFSRCSCDNGPDDPGVEPAPVPDPNQGALFDAGVLMPGVYRDVVLDTVTMAEAQS